MALTALGPQTALEALTYLGASDADADPPGPAALDLRVVDPQALAAASALRDILSELPLADGATLVARVLARPPAIDCWLSAPDARIAIGVAQGVPVRLHPDRVEAIVAALDWLDPLLDRIEAAAGLLLEFTASEDGVGQAVVVELRVVDPAGAVSALFFLAPRPSWRVPDHAIAGRAGMGSAILAISRIVHGPRLSIDDASGIDAGDLLMLSAGSWRMDARALAGSWPGSYDPASGEFLTGPHPATTRSKDQAMNDDADTPPDRLGGFTVPVGIVLPDASATVDELSRLTSGSTLTLGPIAAGIAVELRIADRTVASGELVRLGASYAVLVTEVPATPVASVPSDPTTDAI